MPNVFVVRDPSQITGQSFEAIMPFIAPIIVAVLPGNLESKQVRVMPINAWAGQIHETAISLVVQTKESPEKLSKHRELADNLAIHIKGTLVNNGLLRQDQRVKVSLTLAKMEISTR